MGDRLEYWRKRRVETKERDNIASLFRYYSDRGTIPRPYSRLAYWCKEKGITVEDAMARWKAEGSERVYQIHLRRHSLALMHSYTPHTWPR